MEEKQNQYVQYTNNTGKTEHIGGVTVEAGGTRAVEARFVPASVGVNKTLMLLIFNLGDADMFYGETTVPSGGHIRLSANYFVDPNTPADKAQIVILSGLLEKSVDYITDRFEAFENDELKVLLDLELKGDNRKTLIEAINNQLDDGQQSDGFDPDAYAAELQKASDKDLELELLAADNETTLTSLIEAEQQRRVTLANSAGN